MFLFVFCCRKRKITGPVHGLTKRRPITIERAQRLRRKMTKGEQLLWLQLKLKQFCGLRFRRQVPMGSYIADFYCAEKSLIVEIDGPHHEFQKAYDCRRENFLTKHGLHVIHFTGASIFEDLDGVLKQLEYQIKNLASWKKSKKRSSPPPFTGPNKT